MGGVRGSEENCQIVGVRTNNIVRGTVARQGVRPHRQEWGVVERTLWPFLPDLATNQRDLVALFRWGAATWRGRL